jgi:hypothetical protein
MSTRHSSRTLLPLVLAAAFGALALAPSEVLADRGRVHLNDGSVIRGEIVSYDPGAGVTIQMENGSTIELAADDVARVDIGSDAVDAAAAPTSAVQAPAPPPDTTLQPAMSQPTRSRPGLVGPILTGSIGALLVVTGAPFFATGYACYECYEFTPRQIAGLSLMGVGGALVVSGFGIWMARRVKARRAWDREHVSLRLTPTLGRSHAGLQLTGTF